MNTASVSFPQQSATHVATPVAAPAAVWRLGRRDAATLRPPCPVQLRVTQGRVWLTRDGDPTDYVLAQGEQLWIGRGETVVLEAWLPAGIEASAIELLLAPSPGAMTITRRALRAVASVLALLSDARRRLSRLPARGRPVAARRPAPLACSATR